MAQTDSNPDKHRKNPPRRPAPAPPAAGDGPAIGFNELRQACEISALREDLARLGDEADALCGHIEAGVEQVRARVAGLCAEQLADPEVMAPLLQFAVGTLISIRDRARGLDTRSGVAEDAARPVWTAAAPPLAAPPPSAPERAFSPPTPSAPPVFIEPPPEPPPVAASWLTPPPAPAAATRSPPPLRPAPAAASGGRAPGTGPAAAVDWLGPARK